LKRGAPDRAGAIPAALLAFVLVPTLALAPIAARHKPKTPPVTSSGPRPAPAIDLARWINSKPLKPADLKGKVRLVEFWTLGSVSCRNTVMAMRELHSTYAKRGLVVIGVHSPEFPAERDSAAVAAAVAKYEIQFPVALDNDHLVFNAFKNRYWPALYLIDRKGFVCATHVGELHGGTRAWRNFCDVIDSTLVGKEPQKS
jgi:peroxiredoxin